MSRKLINQIHNVLTALVHHSTYFSCVSLFEGTTNLENMCEEQEHARMLKERGYSTRSLRADDSRFDSKAFERSCEEAH